MHRKWFSLIALIAAATFLTGLSSCAHNQHLLSINVQPTAVTFGAIDNTLAANLKAYGTYNHPPQTKDITAQVTWQSDIPQVAQVTSAGVVSPNTACGIANITATFDDGGNLVISNTSNITVEGPASLGCPQGGSTSSLSVNVTGTGTVTSSPAGIDCGTICAAQFTTGTTVTLTAAPTSPATAVTWGGCDTSSATTCSVLLQANTVVTAAFN